MRNLHLIAWGRVLLEKLIVVCVVQKFPILSKTKIYCYITVCHPYTPGITAPSSPGPPPCWCFTFTLRHSTLRTTPPDGWLAQLRDLYLRTHVTLVRQTFMQLVGFESAIPASKGPQTHVFDRMVTGIDIPVLHQMNQVHIFPCYVFKTCLTVTLPSIPTSSKWFLPFRFPNGNCAPCFCLMHATFSLHLILLVFIILIIYGEVYKSWSSTLNGFSTLTLLLPLFSINALVCTLFSYVCSMFFTLMWRTTSHNTADVFEKLV